MAISFEENWKNILDKLVSTLRSEFGGSLPVHRGNQPGGNQFIQVNPVKNNLMEYSLSSDLRKFQMDILYYTSDINVKDTSLDNVLKKISRIEALIQSNMTMTLADSTRVINCRIESTTLNSDESSNQYVVKFEWFGEHMGNIA